MKTSLLARLFTIILGLITLVIVVVIVIVVLFAIVIVCLSRRTFSGFGDWLPAPTKRKHSLERVPPIHNLKKKVGKAKKKKSTGNDKYKGGKNSRNKKANEK